MDIKVFLAFVPILSLIIFSLRFNVQVAVIVGFILTSALFFYWGASLSYYVATLISALISTMPVIMIVFGAIFLYQVMIHNGMINGITNSLNNLHKSNEVKFFLISVGLTAFFEGVAGFGTPGAIVPPILISLGFNPVMSVAVVLLLDGLFAVFGAIGTPVIIGIKIPLGMADADVTLLSRYTAILISIVSLIFMFAIILIFKRFNKKMEEKSKLILFFTFYTIPFLLISFFWSELSIVLSALTMVILSVLYLSEGKVNIDVKPWIPYFVLVMLLVLPKALPPFFSFLKFELSWINIFSTDVTASIKPLENPFLQFIIVGVGLLMLRRKKGFLITPTLGKVAAVFVILYPSIAISQLMIRSGQQETSMLNYISDVFSLSGSFYPVFSPFIGILGAFVSGSTTVSNIIFGASQMAAAKELELNEIFILALQHTGAAIGNAICLFNIIAAATVANIKDYKAILNLNIIPTLIGGVVLGFMGYLFLII